MNWQSYEETVKDIYERLGKTAGIKILGWGPNCKVKGKSGVNHQIDVLASHSDGIHSYKTAIECKYLKDKVQKDTIAKLAEILEDAKIEKGVVVSKSGFTQDTETFAKYKNIDLVELREPVDEDWEGRVKDIDLRIRVLTPRIYDYKFIREHANDEDESELRRFSASISTSDIFVHTPDGNSTSLREITTSKLSADADSEEGHEKAYSVLFPEGSILSFPTVQVKGSIREIRFKIRYDTVTEEFKMCGEDYVSMVMHAIFENKWFVIPRDGEVRPSDSHSED